jgi:hypothetical protein
MLYLLLQLLKSQIVRLALFIAAELLRQPIHATATAWKGHGLPQNVGAPLRVSLKLCDPVSLLDTLDKTTLVELNCYWTGFCPDQWAKSVPHKDSIRFKRITSEAKAYWYTCPRRLLSRQRRGHPVSIAWDGQLGLYGIFQRQRTDDIPRRTYT